MNELTVFENKDFGQIRTVLRQGEPWFVAADVCKALDVDPTATRRLDDDEKDTLRLAFNAGNFRKSKRDYRQ